MSNLTSVHVTAGIPDSGTGDVSTLDAVLAVLPAALGANGALKVEGVASGTVIPVSDGGGSLTVDGTVSVSGTVTVGSHAVTNAGTFAVQIAANSSVNVAQVAGTTTSVGAGVNGNGVQRVTLPTDQTWPTGMSPRSFVVPFATLTRPANTTGYAAGDSISDNATAGSVTALVSSNISDTNDDPLTLVDIIVTSTDTGLAGKKIRAYVYNSDPTASSGVGGGDNAAFSNKKAGYVGSFMGWMETGFSDGTVGRLVPTFNETNFTQAGSFIVCKPVSGAKTLYIQYQAVEAFTPSANSTTIIGSVRGFQGRAS